MRIVEESDKLIEVTNDRYDVVQGAVLSLIGMLMFALIMLVVIADGYIDMQMVFGLLVGLVIAYWGLQDATHRERYEIDKGTNKVVTVRGGILRKERWEAPLASVTGLIIVGGFASGRFGPTTLYKLKVLGPGDEPKELLFREGPLARKVAEHIGVATDVDVETIKQS